MYIVQIMMKNSEDLRDEDLINDQELEARSESGESLQSDEELTESEDEALTPTEEEDWETEDDFYDSDDNDSDEIVSEYSDHESENSWDEISVTREESPVQVNYNAFYRKINEFYVADKYTDVKITCQDQSFKCHRLVLAAASEYFDTMFYGGFEESHREEINLKNIDVATFEQVLKFAYQGEVVIDDENVYNLLCVSDMLGLSFIEKQCVRYLMERNIPMDYAFDIFSFVILRQKKELMPTLTQFMLDHLEYFSKSDDFLEITFDDLSAWLENCPRLSSRTENILLDTICRWVSRSTAVDKEALFKKLTQLINFEHISAEQIIEYFVKNVIDCDQNTLDVEDSTNSDTFMNESFLHAFVNTKEDHLIRSNIFTLRTDDKEPDWRLSYIVKPFVKAMRTVVFNNNRIFTIKTLNNENLFCARSSIDLSAHSETLALPDEKLNLHASYIRLCCDKNCVYLCSSPGSKTLKDVHVYNPELDSWSSIAHPSERSRRPTMTCDDSRVYLVGGLNDLSGYGLRRIFNAYDHRTGEWEVLPNCRTGHGYRDECCFHKGKIYVSCRSADQPYILEIYDPVAGRWDCTEMNDNPPLDDPVRLLSYGNKLYAFSHGIPRSVHVQMYDSFLQEWSTSTLLQSTIEKKFHLSSLEVLSILDVVVSNY